MSDGIVTFGFGDDGSTIAAMGFGSALSSPIGPTIAPGGIATIGFAGDGSTIATLGFGGDVESPPSGPLSLREAVRFRLTSSSTIAGLVGSRIYFGALPQTADLMTGPALVYSVISRDYGHTLVGADGTSQARVQITAHSISQAASDRVMDSVRQLFDGFRGFIGALEITISVLENEIDLPYNPRSGTDQWYYEIAADYQINHRVSLPGSLS